MTPETLIVVVALLGVLAFLAGLRNLGIHRTARGVTQLLVSASLLFAVACGLVATLSLRTYQRLTSERPAAALVFTRIGYHQFTGMLTLPSGESEEFELRGDEWQIDARVLKWRGLQNVLGFDTAYRLDRISGRYTNIDDERSLPRTVYSLNHAERLDLWTIAHQYHAWVPWIDALYGSAAYLPMADGARYTISVSQSGLIARADNHPAQAAITDWQ